MLIRLGFIANSSSSSCIVSSGNPHWITLTDPILSIGEEGEVEFGWGPKIIKNVYSKINFAYLQILHLRECLEPCSVYRKIDNKWHKKWQDKYLHDDLPDKWTKLLFEVISIEVIQTNVIEKMFESGDAYIDHQSNVEDDRNTHMFESKESMKRFLLDSNIWIILDNDNDRNYEDGYPGKIWNGEV